MNMVTSSGCKTLLVRSIVWIDDGIIENLSVKRKFGLHGYSSRIVWRVSAAGQGCAGQGWKRTG